MRQLINGVQEFQRDAFDTQRDRFVALTKGQHPLALFITCSDSRIDPSLITQTRPGELFVIRNAGNLVPAYSDSAGGEAATIEYAVKVLEVKDIVICGHSHCGAMGGLLDPDAVAPLPTLTSWLKHAEVTRQIVDQQFSQGLDSAERLTKTVEQNVLVQMENLKTHPCVAEAVANANLGIHGWVYEFETGQVFAHEDGANQFRSLAEPSLSRSHS